MTVPRQVFGNLQARQFPIFFAYSTLGALGLLTLDIKLRPALISSFKHAPFQTLRAMNTGAFWSSTAGLAIVTGMTHAVNGLYVTPKASECMFERHRLERIEGKTSESSVSSGVLQCHHLPALMSTDLSSFVATRHTRSNRKRCKRSTRNSLTSTRRPLP